MKETYNGWTNYATWKVNLEILGDLNFEGKVCPNQLKETVKHFVLSDHEESLMQDYASAFIEQVNFHEIAESINEELKLC